jgi:endonuclease G
MKPVPERIASAARNRVQRSAKQRQQALAAIASGRPMDAEPDRDRRVRRIRRITGVALPQAEAMADYARPAELGLAGERRLGAERIQGLTTDFVGVSFLDLARSAANAVGRIAYRTGQPLGSGFLISPRLLLTNNHVIARGEEAAGLAVEFNYELGIDGRPEAITRFALAPALLFLTNPEDDLDFTLVALGERLDGPGAIEDFGYCPLRDTPDRHVIGEFVNLVQHPAGDYKQVVLRENRLVWRSDHVLHYVADTEPGSSGSPVFNDQWEPIALHHWGEPFRDTVDAGGRPLAREVNEGIRISAVVKALREAQGLSRDARNLLEDALWEASRPVTPPSIPVETNKRRDEQAAGGTWPLAPRVNADGTATWSIRLEFTVGLRVPSVPGAPADSALVPPPAAAVLPTVEPAPERVEVDRRYGRRNGYNPRFLPGFRVDLPKLAPSHRPAPLREPPADDNPNELKYQHFSIVMNAERKLAYFTAVNIDGASWVHILRETGEPKSEAAEAKEVWFDEPRLAPEHQCAQDLYDGQRPRRLFDRGHLVRREDPNWGTAARAKRANADTFHFTNCTPQASTFNQRAQFWQGIENYVLDNAKAERERVTVFTGPVFDDRDPKYRYVKVPRRFWKILVRVEDGELLATAMIADQSDMIRRLPERLGQIVEDAAPEDYAEAFGDMGEIAEYQTSVAEIERLTGLDFGELRDHDTFAGGPEGAEATRRLRSFDELSLGRAGDGAGRTRRNNG